MSIKLTHEEFLERFYQNNSHANDIEILGEYKSRHEHIKCRCKICNREWSTPVGSLLQGHGCKKCNHFSYLPEPKKISHEEFLERFYQNNSHANDIEILGRYEGSNKHIKCRCKICGREWSPEARDLYRRHAGCKKCKKNGPNKLSHEEFLEKFYQKNSHANDIEILGRYKGSDKHIKCRCKICGREWDIFARSLLDGCGCQQCFFNIIKRISHEEFLEKFYQKNSHANNIEILGKYQTAKDRIKCRCKICGKEWNPFAYDLLKGNGCTACRKCGTSFAEQYIFKSLEYILGSDKVINRTRNIIDKELDIYLPDYNYAIEFGSFYWHSNKINSIDLQKIEQCKEKNIYLLTIYDQCNIEFDNPNIITFTKYIGDEKDHSSLKSIIKRICNDINIPMTLNENDFKSIESLIINTFNKHDYDEFMKKFYQNNPYAKNIEILNHPNRVIHNTDIECKCKLCGREWVAHASQLTNFKKATGCKFCNSSKISIQQAIDLYYRMLNGEKSADISKEINIHETTLCNIKFCRGRYIFLKDKYGLEPQKKIIKLRVA